MLDLASPPCNFVRICHCLLQAPVLVYLHGLQCFVHSLNVDGVTRVPFFATMPRKLVAEDLFRPPLGDLDFRYRTALLPCELLLSRHDSIFR